jgi:hypothetical protein
MDIIAATHALSSAEPRRSHRATGRAVQSQLSQFLINAGCATRNGESNAPSWPWTIRV